MRSRSKSNSGISNFTPAFVLFVVAALLLGGSTIDMCEGCSGWGTISPFCQLGNVACVAQWGTIHMLMQGMALIMIIAGTVRLIRTK